MPSCRRSLGNPAGLGSPVPRRLAVLCLALLAAGGPAHAARVWTADSLTKVFPGTPPGEVASVALDACQGEWESFQVVLRAAKPIAVVRITASALHGPGVIPADRVALFQEHFVRIENPSGNAVSEPREWPDALLPMSVLRQAKAAAGKNLAFWVTVRVPPEARPGSYQGAVTLWSGAARMGQIPISLRVWDIPLPAGSHQGATAALYYGSVCDYLNKHFRKGRPPLADGTPEWEALKQRYWSFLLDYRICPYDLPVPVTSPKAERFLRDERLSRYRLPWVGEDAQFRAQVEALRGYEALPRGFYYQYDEPRMEQYEEVRRLAGRVRAANPSLRRLLTLFPTPDLQGAVEIWCPDIGDTFGPGYLDHEILRRRRESGEETWWYTMCVPRYPYPTWLVDDDATAHRVFPWMQALYGITGFVYSQVHGWSDDPYANVASFAGSNGDGLLLYPGQAFGSPDPFPSIRLQVIRDALEDYECLWLLREETLRALREMGAPDAEALAQGTVASYCRRLIASERAFSRCQEEYAAARRDLLEEILSCRERPWLAAAVAEEGSSLALAAEPGSQVEVAGQPVALDASGRAACRAGEFLLPATVTARKDGRTHTLKRWPLWPVEVAPEPPGVTCSVLATAPVIDGAIAPEEWRDAAVIRPALRANGLGPAAARTECFLGRDAGRLYFAARCPLGASLPEEQAAGLILDPPPLGDAKLELLMAGTGKRYATLRSRRGHATPRLGWRWAQRAAGGVWECEMSLEFGDLVPAPEAGAEWGANFERQCGSEQATWALSYGDVRRLGRMSFTAAPK